METEQARPFTIIGFSLPVPAQPATWLATWVSHLASPPFFVIGGAFLVAAPERTAAAWGWVVAHLLLAVALPLAYIIMLVQQGRATDIHLPDRRERLRPLLLATLGGSLAYLLLHLGAAPPALVRLAAAGAIQTGLVFLITFYWKISMHTAAVTGIAVVAVVLLGPAGLWLAPLIPLVTWARLHLRRHTPAQTVGGVLCGGLVFGLLFALPML